MKPINFKEATHVFGKGIPDQLELPVLKQDKNVVCLWKMTPFERIKCLFTGKVWLLMVTRKQEIPSTLLTVNKDDLLEK